jgi:hypothetical protein
MPSSQAQVRVAQKSSLACPLDNEWPGRFREFYPDVFRCARPKVLDAIVGRGQRNRLL